MLCRGGTSEYSPGPGYVQPPYEGYPPPDLPSDMPAVDEDPYSISQHQHDPREPQQSQQQPPPLPPDFGDGRGPPPPPGYEESRFQDPDPMEEEIETIDSWADTANESSGMDMSAFDKEYILKGLARLYRKKILPLEISSRYGHFHSPPLSPSDFVAPPMVLLLGQYRYVGKRNIDFSCPFFLTLISSIFSKCGEDFLY